MNRNAIGRWIWSILEDDGGLYHLSDTGQCVDVTLCGLRRGSGIYLNDINEARLALCAPKCQACLDNLAMGVKEHVWDEK